MEISLRAFARVSCGLLMAGIFLFARPLGAQHSAPAADAQKPPLLSAAEVGALDQELSGETAKRNLEGIVRFHRVRGSRGFHDAAELVAETSARLWIERCANSGISCGRENILWNAAVASAMGCGFCGTLGDAGAGWEMESGGAAGELGCDAGDACGR